MIYKIEIGNIRGHKMYVEVIANDDETAKKEEYITRMMINQAFKINDLKTND